MSTATLRAAPRGAPRYVPRGALPVALALAHAAVLLAAPCLAVVALGLWWGAQTVSHHFIHRPFFRWRALNALFALYLTALLGLPQSVWRDRHLAHHAGAAWQPRLTAQIAAECLLLVAMWAAQATWHTRFFLTAYLPGLALGLALCWLHGHYEHARGTTSHYGRLYNFLFLNDGYHAEHHARPGAHWSELPAQRLPGARASRWPAVLRWLDELSLEGLERLVLRSARLQRFVLDRHERAFRRLMPPLPAAPRVAVVGGGLFPRTLMALRRLLPSATFTVIDRSAENIAVARALAPAGVEFLCACYDPALATGYDVVVFPLALAGDRAAIYRDPPAPAVFVHDWVWRRRGESTVVSWLLLKRLNLVRPLGSDHESGEPAGSVRPDQGARPGES